MFLQRIFVICMNDVFVGLILCNTYNFIVLNSKDFACFLTIYMCFWTYLIEQVKRGSQCNAVYMDDNDKSFYNTVIIAPVRNSRVLTNITHRRSKLLFILYWLFYLSLLDTRIYLLATLILITLISGGCRPL